MPRNKEETHRKVLEAARAEFMEYGFERASMRRIGERCGITAAGLYRHCRDKEDLFCELVAPAIEGIERWLEAHVKRSFDAMESEEVDLWNDSNVDMMRDLIYPNMDDYRLLLTKAQGTKYENFMHDMTENQQGMMLKFLPLIKEKGYPVRDIDPKELHLLLSAYLTALFEPVIHGYTQEEAYRCLDTVEEFFIPGWKLIMGV